MTMKPSSKSHAAGWMKLRPNMYSLHPELGCSLRKGLVLDQPRNVFVEALWTSGWHYGEIQCWTNWSNPEGQFLLFYAVCLDLGGRNQKFINFALKKDDNPIKEKLFSIAETWTWVFWKGQAHLQYYDMWSQSNGLDWKVLRCQHVFFEAKIWALKLI